MKGSSNEILDGAGGEGDDRGSSTCVSPDDDDDDGGDDDDDDDDGAGGPVFSSPPLSPSISSLSLLIDDSNSRSIKKGLRGFHT